jgi:hypothetical protein
MADQKKSMSLTKEKNSLKNEPTNNHPLSKNTHRQYFNNCTKYK